MKIIDDIPRHLTMDDYHDACMHFEKLCIMAGIPEKNIGYFGSITLPGISDIDAAVVGNAVQLKALDNLFIAEQAKQGKFALMFCHRPVYVLDTALPFIHNLHTLIGLDDRISKLIRDTDPLPASSEHKLLNIIWFTFLLRTISQVQRADSISLRSLSFLYKNIKHSNTVFSGMSSASKSTLSMSTDDLRKSIWERTYDQEQIFRSFGSLFADTMTEFDRYCEAFSPAGFDKPFPVRPIIVDKKMVILPAKFSELEHMKAISVLHVNDYAYHLAKGFFADTSYCSRISGYMACLRKAHGMYASAGLVNPFVTPFQIQLNGVTGLMKVILNRLLNFAPLGRAFIHSQCQPTL